MKYGYARVSTTDQKLANQIELLKLAEQKKSFRKSLPAQLLNDQEFQKLFARSKKHGDTLIVTKLDGLR
ncbi:recombinase family protein, partial [Lactiplantibacillus paraplantarum]